MTLHDLNRSILTSSNSEEILNNPGCNLVKGDSGLDDFVQGVLPKRILP